jgi:hypothetical protein
MKLLPHGSQCKNGDVLKADEFLASMDGGRRTRKREYMAAIT